MTDPRRCSCKKRVVLSRYNPDDVCFPCQTDQRINGVIPDGRPDINRQRSQSLINQETDELLEAIRAHTTGPFRAMHLRPWVALRGPQISQLMIRLERAKKLVRVEAVRGNEGGRVVVWDLAERRKREVA